MRLMLPAMLASVGIACSTDADCSLNGLCKSGSCDCSTPWGGQQCGELQFEDVHFPQGYGTPDTVTSWGGNALYNESEGLYHAYISRMTNECKLDDWHKNSRIDHVSIYFKEYDQHKSRSAYRMLAEYFHVYDGKHQFRYRRTQAVSSNITGPYTFVGVAINTWSHNAAPVKLKDGTFAIFHIGDGSGSPNGGAHCGNSSEAAPDAVLTQQNSQVDHAKAKGPQDHSTASKGSTIHVSDSLYGPWEPLQPNPMPSCNNPSPWVHPDNGTLYLLCREGKLYKTESISDGYEFVAQIPLANPYATHMEDPFLFTDSRGNWHAIFHAFGFDVQDQCRNSTVALHTYSPNGYNWTMSPVHPYTTQVPIGMGEYMTVSTRERPKLWFNKEGVPTHLFNGVSGVQACPGVACVACKTKGHAWCYTLVAPLQVP